MTNAEIRASIKSVQAARKRLRALPPDEAKKESYDILLRAGIITKSGKLSKRYRTP